jgi:predicted transcriptional regulator of viral defense system
MTRSLTLSRIAEVAQDQWGLITRRQAELVGVPQTTMDRLTAPGSTLDRVAHGVYRMAGAPEPEHLALRAAWLQLEPGVWAWERTPAQGVVSHRSAAALYGLGDLPADRHEFAFPGRKQTRRPDVRLHQRSLPSGEWVILTGLPVTRPARIASDLLDDHEDPEGVAQIVMDAIRGNYDSPRVFADSLAAQASRFGLRRADGLGVVRWLLGLVGDPGTPRWLDEARAHLERELARSSGPQVAQ